MTAKRWSKKVYALREQTSRSVLIDRRSTVTIRTADLVRDVAMEIVWMHKDGLRDGQKDGLKDGLKDEQHGIVLSGIEDGGELWK